MAGEGESVKNIYRDANRVTDEEPIETFYQEGFAYMGRKQEGRPALIKRGIDWRMCKWNISAWVHKFADLSRRKHD